MEWRKEDRIFALKSHQKSLLRAGGRGELQWSGMPVSFPPGQWRRRRPRGGHSVSASPDPCALQSAVLSILHTRLPSRLSMCWCVTRLLVVLSSKNELPGRTSPLGDIGWTPCLGDLWSHHLEVVPSLPGLSLQFGWWPHWFHYLRYGGAGGLSLSRGRPGHWRLSQTGGLKEEKPEKLFLFTSARRAAAHLC